MAIKGLEPPAQTKLLCVRVPIGNELTVTVETEVRLQP